jgi:hypothetical protein
MTAPNPPAGWFPDPHDPTRKRWWDGAAWTEHVQQAAPPAPPAVAVQQPVQTVQPVLSARSYSAPLSFVGSTRRITGWARGAGSTAAKVGAWSVAVIALPLVWAFVACWYLVAFGLFGLFTIPFRLIRRSQRKTQHLQQAQLATLQQQQWNR